MSAADLAGAIERIEATIHGLQGEITLLRDAVNKIAVGIRGEYGAKGIEDRMEAYEQLADINNKRLALLEEWRAKVYAIVGMSVAAISVIAAVISSYKLLVP
ncbi:MAG: hypothetical protein WC977_13270 [Anaerovoracaceae bacterium]